MFSPATAKVLGDSRRRELLAEAEHDRLVRLAKSGRRTRGIRRGAWQIWHGRAEPQPAA